MSCKAAVTRPEVYHALAFSPDGRLLALGGRPPEARVGPGQDRPPTGEVRVRLQAGSAVVTGRRSPAGLYDYGLATYDTGDVFDQTLAKGFVELWGLPSKIAAERDRKAAHA